MDDREGERNRLAIVHEHIGADRNLCLSSPNPRQKEPSVTCMGWASGDRQPQECSGTRHNERGKKNGTGRGCAYQAMSVMGA